MQLLNKFMQSHEVRIRSLKSTIFCSTWQESGADEFLDYICEHISHYLVRRSAELTYSDIVSVGRKSTFLAMDWSTCLCYPSVHYEIKTFDAYITATREGSTNSWNFIAHLIWSSFYFHFGISCDSTLISGLEKYINATEGRLAGWNADESVAMFLVCHL